MGYTVDVNKFRGKMAEKGYKLDAFAKELGITRNTLATYIKEPGKIPMRTVSRMAELLCDSSDEARSIFLAHDLRGTQDIRR